MNIALFGVYAGIISPFLLVALSLSCLPLSPVLSPFLLVTASTLSPFCLLLFSFLSLFLGHCVRLVSVLSPFLLVIAPALSPFCFPLSPVLSGFLLVSVSALSPFSLSLSPVLSPFCSCLLLSPLLVFLLVGHCVRLLSLLSPLCLQSCLPSVSFFPSCFPSLQGACCKRKADTAVQSWTNAKDCKA